MVRGASDDKRSHDALPAKINFIIFVTPLS